MSQYSNDEKMYSQNYGSILSDDQRKVLENKLTKKMVDIPKPLLEELKELKCKYVNSNFYNFNESMIIRVGTRLILEGINNLVISLINDEEGLIKFLWAQFNIERNKNSANNGCNLYSRKVHSILSPNGKDYELYCIRKSVSMPYNLYAQVKIAKITFERETGSYWIKDNTFFKIGLQLMLELLLKIDIRSIKTDEELLNKVKEVTDTL